MTTKLEALSNNQLIDALEHYYCRITMVERSNNDDDANELLSVKNWHFLQKGLEPIYCSEAEIVERIETEILNRISISLSENKKIIRMMKELLSLRYIGEEEPYADERYDFLQAQIDAIRKEIIARMSW